PDLRPVAVRDHQCALIEQRLQGRDRAAQVCQLLRRSPSLAGTHERVPAESYDRTHTSAVSSSPFSARTSFNVGSPRSWSLSVTRKAGLSMSISLRRSIGAPINTR